MNNKKKGPPTDPMFPDLTSPSEAGLQGLKPAEGARVESVTIEPDSDPSYGLNLPNMSQRVTMSDTPIPLNGEIRVTTAAYCYDGRLSVAPPWIDRNWLGNEGGPVLYVAETDYEVPEPQEGVIQAHPPAMTARVGDWVVREDAVLPDGRKVQGRLKVVRKDEADLLGLVEKVP